MVVSSAMCTEASNDVSRKRERTLLERPELPELVDDFESRLREIPIVDLRRTSVGLCPCGEGEEEKKGMLLCVCQSCDYNKLGST